MKQLTVPARVEELDAVQEFIETLLTEAGADAKKRINVAVVVEEVFVNIASYAYPFNEGNATVCAKIENNRLILEFSDSGTAYNPLEKTDPDISLSAEEREIGGLGIFMVKKMMDDVRYEYRDGQNVLTLEKDLSA